LDGLQLRWLLARRQDLRGFRLLQISSAGSPDFKMGGVQDGNFTQDEGSLSTKLK
jgi:hypothetical protein